MKTTLLLTAGLTLCAGLTTPLGRHQLDDPSGLDDFVFPEWTVTNFDGGCSPGGCIVTFNFSSPATAAGPPAVAASCDVNGDRREWQACALLLSTFPSSSSSSSSSSLSLAIRGDDGGIPATTIITTSTLWAMPEPAIDAFVVSLQHRYASMGSNVTRVYNVTGNVTVDFEKVSLPVNATVQPAMVTEDWWLSKNVTAGDCVGIGRACRAVRNGEGLGM